MSSIREFREELTDLADRMEHAKQTLWPDDVRDPVVAAKIHLGDTIRELRRFAFLLEKAQALQDRETRWQEDLEAGAIG